MSKETFIKKFDELFNTEFHKQDKSEFNLLINAKKKELKVGRLNSDNFLLLLSYLYLESKNFCINGDNKIQSYKKNLEYELKKAFRKPLICYSTNKNFILIVTKKVKGDELDPEDLFKNVKAYKGSDIIYFNNKDKTITFTKGEAGEKIKKLINEKKLSLVISQPKEVDFDPIEKILNSKKIDIFEVDFRSINFERIKGLYLKTGSMETKINSKIKKIRKVLLEKKILRVSNIKKIRIGLKGRDRKESSCLVVTAPKKLGIFKIKWKGNALDKLDKLIKQDILKGVLNVDLIDKESSLNEKILNMMGKEIRYDFYVSNVQGPLNKGDKYKIIKYENNKIKPDYIRFEKVLVSGLQDTFTIKKTKVRISKAIVKQGFLLKLNENSRELFLLLNKRGLSDKLRKSLNKKLPIVIIDFYDKDIEENNRYNFLDFNEKGMDNFIGFIKNVCNHAEFFKNQQKYFVDAKDKLRNIENSLGRIKDNQKKGSEWEDVCGDILNFIFRKTFPLSGPNLPDGISFINGKNSFLWDSKALYTKKLKDSITEKNKKPKDLAYVEVFRKRFRINYYIFLTCGVDEANFNEANKILSEYNINVKFCCMTNNALLNLCEYFADSSKATIFHKNLNIFCDNLKNILKNGYVDSIKFEDVAKGIGDFEINKEDLRNEVKMEEN